LELLVASYRRGEAAVWIRNTVHDAIAAFRRLQSEIGPGVELFHARFALGDRMERETAVLETFGKVDKRGRNRVLVATQVVEQALDLDFDSMLSDLAPIDLLIQRAGRLHRHDRGERPEPVLHILAPEPVADAMANWFAAMFPKGQYFYADHGQLWLTMRHMLDRGGLILASRSPREPIESVFAEDQAIPEGLRDISGRAAGVAMSRRGHAAMNALKLVNGYAYSSGLWQSDAIAPTRLGSPQRILRLARWDGHEIRPWWNKEVDEHASWRLWPQGNVDLSRGHFTSH
jgi:CRISPR-associated endonuclease/helicase Cas3